MPSPHCRIATLEAEVYRNNIRIAELTHTNWLLHNYSDGVLEEIANLEVGFSNQDISIGDILPEPSPYLQIPLISTSSVPTQDLQRPGPLPAPFYIAARESPQLHLDLIIPGFKGETLKLAVNNVDLAFILQQTLKRKGWGDATIQRSVRDFLEQPMMKVTWLGKEGELGSLL